MDATEALFVVFILFLKHTLRLVVITDTMIYSFA